MQTEVPTIIMNIPMYDLQVDTCSPNMCDTTAVTTKAKEFVTGTAKVRSEPCRVVKKMRLPSWLRAKGTTYCGRQIV